MQFVSAQPLIDKFSQGEFHDDEVAPYFMAYMVLTVIGMFIAFEEYTVWDLIGLLTTVITTVLGVLYLKKQNKDSYGDQFLAKYFCLGWVVGIRVVLIALPLIFLSGILDSILGSYSCFFWFLFGALFEIGYYLWLGKMIARSNGVMPPSSSVEPSILPPIS